MQDSTALPKPMSGDCSGAWPGTLRHNRSLDAALSSKVAGEVVCLSICLTALGHGAASGRTSPAPGGSCRKLQQAALPGQTTLQSII
jgi:hypothetical protein